MQDPPFPSQELPFTTIISFDLRWSLLASTGIQLLVLPKKILVRNFQKFDLILSKPIKNHMAQGSACTYVA